ncbi:MAG TPA: ABC transporter ATP-binding protein [Candidatus Deferrimicrobium sp.]|nr:ABC transporter ATP-binding protein [Candidatus Deferrimicrobium sp.]
MRKPATTIIDKHYVEFSLEKDPFEKARQKGPNSWVLSHILKGINKLLLIFSVILTILSAIMSSGIMIILGMAITDLIGGGTLAALSSYVWIILLLGIGSPLLALFNFFIREVLAQKIEREARKEFYGNLLGKSQSFHDLQRIGDIMARATNDVRMLNYLVSPALSLIINAFTNLIVPIVFILIFYPSQLIVAPLIFTIFFLIFLRDYNKKMGPVTGKLRGEFGLMNANLTETLSGIEVVKASTQEKRELEKYLKNARLYRDAYVEQGIIEGKYIPLLLIAIVITLGLAHAIILNITTGFNIGQIIGFVGLLTQLRFPTYISIFVFAMVRLAISGAKRLLEIMNKETEIDENANGIVKNLQGTITFDNVSFTYPNSEKPVLQNISFEIQAGKTVAIVGTTGSGKSTLTKLLSRLYDVSKGKILIDNIDVRDYALKSLRAQISYIEQDIFLFSTSILENITFGKISSMEEVIKVAKQAQAHEFIMALPKNYESEVGERGVQLSGGERQRIAIARSFLTDPAILILDDSTSAIDSDTEDGIQRAINEIRKGRTTFLITHRLSQIRWADLILVLKNGRIVAKGSHEDLLRTSEEYQNIFVKRFDIDINQLQGVC